jgi:hypothetical protein
MAYLTDRIAARAAVAESPVAVGGAVVMGGSISGTFAYLTSVR